MVRSLITTALVATSCLAWFPLTTQAGMITSVTTSGTGGTATATLQTATTAFYAANLTSTGPIDFTFDVTGGDTYYLDFANSGNVTDSTGLTLQSLQLTLLSARFGGAFVSGGSYQNTGPLSNGKVIGGGSAFQVYGPPYLSSGQSSTLGVTVNATNLSGNFSFVLELTGTPLAGSVPEPASVVMTSLGLLGAVGYSLRRKTKV